MNPSFRFAGALVPVLVFALPLAAQNAGKPESGITREQGEQILQELRQIRQLLERQQKPTGGAAKLNLDGVEMLGSKTAPITVVEFTDYQCPFCQRFHVNTFADLKKSFIDTGKVRFYSRDLPLDSLHPNAFRAALAGRCAGEQGQFWKMRDLMAANPGKLDLDSLLAHATSLHLNVDAFRSCIESNKYKEAVQSDYLEAIKLGIGGTPSFVVGRSTPEGVEGDVMEGALPLTEFAKVFSKIEAGR